MGLQVFNNQIYGDKIIQTKKYARVSSLHGCLSVFNFVSSIANFDRQQSAVCSRTDLGDSIVFVSGSRCERFGGPDGSDEPTEKKTETRNLKFSLEDGAPLSKRIASVYLRHHVFLRDDAKRQRSLVPVRNSFVHIMERLDICTNVKIMFVSRN